MSNREVRTDEISVRNLSVIQKFQRNDLTAYSDISCLLNYHADRSVMNLPKT